jgi:hypothetical protein
MLVSRVIERASRIFHIHTLVFLFCYAHLSKAESRTTRNRIEYLSPGAVKNNTVTLVEGIWSAERT